MVDAIKNGQVKLITWFFLCKNIYYFYDRRIKNIQIAKQII